MRKLLALVSVLAFAACGGSSSSGGGTQPLTATVAGHSFTPKVNAIVVGTGTTPCTGVPTLNTVGLKGLAIQITSFDNACADFTSTACTYHKSSEMVTVLVAKLAVVSPATEPTIPAGDYTINSLPIPPSNTPDGQGQLTIGYAQAIATDATCNGGAPTVARAVSGGKLHVDETIGATAPTGPVTGTVTVTFSDGSSVSGSFSAAVCSEQPQVCNLVTMGGLCDASAPTCM